MNTISTLKEILEIAETGNLYVRWSRGPEMDKAQGRSRDYASGGSHNGLSAQRIGPDNHRDLTARMLVEYRFLRSKDSEIYGWVFLADEVGRDSDNAQTVDAASIVPVGRLSESLVDALSAYSEAYWSHHNSKPKTWAERDAWFSGYPKLSDFVS